MEQYLGKVVYVERTLLGNEIDLVNSSYSGKVEELLESACTYRHYGIGVEDDKIIHFDGDFIAGFNSFEIKESTVDEFLAGGEMETCFRVSYEYSADEVVERAKSSLKTDFGGYHFFKNNCEHFTSWCATGKRISSQVWFMNDDEYDVVEKAIDRVFEPILEIAAEIDEMISSKEES